MFLVRHAKEVMDTGMVVALAAMSFETFLCLPDHKDRMRHVVVTDGNRVVGVLRVNTALRKSLRGIANRHCLAGYSQPQLHCGAGGRYRVRCDPAHWRKQAMMAPVISGRGAPRPGNVAGVITKEHVADSVGASVMVYSVSS